MTQTIESSSQTDPIIVLETTVQAITYDIQNNRDIQEADVKTIEEQWEMLRHSKDKLSPKSLFDKTQKSYTTVFPLLKTISLDQFTSLFNVSESDLDRDQTPQVTRIRRIASASISIGRFYARNLVDNYQLDKAQSISYELMGMAKKFLRSKELLKTTNANIIIEQMVIAWNTTKLQYELDDDGNLFSEHTKVIQDSLSLLSRVQTLIKDTYRRLDEIYSLYDKQYKKKITFHKDSSSELPEIVNSLINYHQNEGDLYSDLAALYLRQCAGQNDSSPKAQYYLGEARKSLEYALNLHRTQRLRNEDTVENRSIIEANYTKLFLLFFEYYASKKFITPILLEETLQQSIDHMRTSIECSRNLEQYNNTLPVHTKRIIGDVFTTLALAQFQLKRVKDNDQQRLKELLVNSANILFELTSSTQLVRSDVSEHELLEIAHQWYTEFIFQNDHGETQQLPPDDEAQRRLSLNFYDVLSNNIKSQRYSNE